MKNFANSPVTAGIVMATYKEAVPFVTGTGFEQIIEKPFPVYRTGMMHLVISGIGKTSCAVATSFLIWRCGVTHLFNLGAAGATSEGMKIGDILHIDRSIEYDARRKGEPRHKFFTPHTMEGYRSATLSTHDVPVMSHGEREKVSRISGLADMEGSAFIQASQAFGARPYLFKIVTDAPGNTETAEIIDNMKLTRDILFRFFMDDVYPKFIIL